MRICLISREYPPETGWGGIATFARHLAHGLSECGHEVEVVSLSQSDDKTTWEDGILVHRVTTNVISGGLSAMSLWAPYSRYVVQTTMALWKKFLELNHEKPFDVVDTPELLAEGLMQSVTKVAPLVIRLYTPHSKFIAEKLHNVKPSFDHELVAMLERVAMLKADCLTSPSDDLARFVSTDLNYPLPSIRIVRNPIDPVEFSPEGPRSLAQAKGKTVLFVGRLEERKGIHYLIDAIPEILSAAPDTRFVIIGDDTKSAVGHTSVLAELKRSIAEHGTGSSITFIPRVPLKELPAYYRSADISCVPSVYDNSPYTCLEAMSCGVPVIGTTGGGTGEYIVDGTSGLLVSPRDTAALAKAIIRLLKNEDERKSMGSAARARVLECFQRKEIARQMLEVYAEAQAKFASNRKNVLYQKSPDEALADAEYFLYSSDRMVYDMLYTHSFGFRLRHWWRLTAQRPRLAVAKAAARIIELFCRAFGIKQELLEPWPDQLRREIERKQYLGEDSDPFDELFAANQAKLQSEEKTACLSGPNHANL